VRSKESSPHRNLRLLTRQQLSEAVQVSLSTIDRAVRDKNSPALTQAVQFALRAPLSMGGSGGSANDAPSPTS
jgi:DNA-directed RNA polymerase specialized sigma54-like protein